MPAVNDGWVIYTLLVQYSNLTGQPTGLQKPNNPSDPDYVAPVYDAVACPPGEPLPATMSIIVEIDAQYTVDINLRYGASTLTRNTSGTWVVPARIYDGVSFAFSAAPQAYSCIVTYDNGISIVSASGSGLMHLLIPGPFNKITKIQVVPNVGDFNNDFNNDFNV